MSLRLISHTQKEIPALNGLRGIAVLLVLLFHNFTYLQVTYFGWIGVDLFFVLSGFLITRILVEAKNKDNYFKNFYARRVLRIFPLYYLSIILFLLAERCFSLPASLSFGNHLGYYLVYFQNFIYFLHVSQNWPNYILNHFWSLSVEEHFYLLWPWIVFYLSNKNVLRVALAIIISSRILSVFLLKLDMSWIAVYTFSFTRFETLAVGAILAVLVKERTAWVEKWARPALLLSGVSILGFIAYYIFRDKNLLILMPDNCLTESWSFIFPAIAVFFASTMVYALAENSLQRLLENRWLVQCGKYSYGIYIFHNPIYAIATYLVNKESTYFNWPVQITVSILCTAGTWGVAYLSYNYYEEYFLRLKNRFV